MKKFLSLLLFACLLPSSALGLDVIQNLARSFVLEAPALDKTDGVTAETALTPGTFVVKKYSKNKAPVTVTITTAVFASSIITNTGNMTDGDTITFTGNLIDSQSSNLTTEVYRFKNTLAQAYDVKIGASAAITWDNLKCAINDTGCGGEGTDWGTGTVASVLVNATTNSDTQQTVVANIPGTIGNSFTTAETSSAASWTGSTLASGADGMVHDASGYYWFCQPAAFWDTLGDMLLTFNYNAEAAPYFQKVRVVANRSDEMNVRGLGSSVDELLETNLNTVGSTSAWAYKLNQLDIATSNVWNELLSNHTVVDSFGERLLTSSVTFGTADSGSTTTVVDTERTEADTDYWVGSLIRFTSGSISGQTRVITGFNAATDTITFAPATTQAVSTNTYKILPTGDFLRPTVSGRTLDVTTTGGAGIDWANVESPTTTVTLSGTTVKTATDVETDTQDIQSRLPAALGANGNLKADVRDYNGTAGTFASGRPEVNATHLGGTSQTGRDIGASVLLSSGIGTGQVKLSSGYVAPNWGDVGNPTTTVNLSGTTVKQVTDVDTKLGTPVTNVSADIAAVKIDTAAIKTKTDFLPSATAGAAGGVFIAGTNAATTITTGLTTTFTGNLTGSVGSVTGAVGSVTGLTPATVHSDLDDIQSKIGTPAGASVSADVAAVKSDSAAIKTKTDFLPSATAGAAGGVFIAGTNAATTITTALTTTFTGNLTGSVASVTGAVGSVTGAVGSVAGNVDGNVTGTTGGMTAAGLAKFFNTNSGTTYASAVAGSVVKEIANNSGGSALTVGAIADAVWDEVISEHLTAGTTGNKLNAAASAGDPWSTSLPGAYGAGTAGKILGDNLNATVSSRATQANLDVALTSLTNIQGRLPAALISGRMDSSVGAMAANVLTAAAINTDAFTAAKFAADASTEFAATLMATPFEGSHTFKHFLQYGASALFGKYNSSGSTFNFRDLADSKNRIVYSTSSTARTAVTLSPD